MNHLTVSRRRFLTLTGAAAAGLLISAPAGAFGKRRPMTRFGILTDVHYADREPAGDRFYRQSLGKVKEAIDLMNREKVDFVIELGDFKDQDALPNEARTLNHLETIEEVFQQFKGPTYHVLGNHDMDSISKEQFLTRVVNTGIAVSESYYSFNQNGFHFVILDGNFSRDGIAYDHGNFSWDNTCIPEVQVNWLKKDLAASSLPVIVFIHQMLDDAKSLSQSVQNATEIRQILEQSAKVVCVFQGHVHEERYSMINGIHYCSFSAVVDHEGIENNSYMIVEIFKDQTLEVNGFRRATDRKFPKKL